MQGKSIVRLRFGDELGKELLLPLRKDVGLREQLTDAVIEAKKRQVIDRTLDLADASVTIDGKPISALDDPPSAHGFRRTGRMPLLVVRTQDTPLAVTIVVKSDETKGKVKEIDTRTLDPSLPVRSELERLGIQELLQGHHWFKKSLDSLKDLRVKRVAARRFRRILDLDSSLWKQGVRRAERLEVSRRVWWAWPSRFCFPPPLTSLSIVVAFVVALIILSWLWIRGVPSSYDIRVTSPAIAKIMIDGRDELQELVASSTKDGLYQADISNLEPGPLHIRVFPKYSGVWDTTIHLKGRLNKRLPVTLERSDDMSRSTVLSGETFRKISQGKSFFDRARPMLNFWPLEGEGGARYGPGEYHLTIAADSTVLSEWELDEMQWVVKTRDWITATSRILLPPTLSDVEDTFEVDLYLDERHK